MALDLTRDAANLVARIDDSVFESLMVAFAMVVMIDILPDGTSQRDRWEDADSLATFSGIAPVTRKSGRQRQVHRRYACPKFLRQTFHEFADRARQYCPWSRARYRMLRDRGMKHHAALRKIARSWIRILFRVWQTRVPFDCDRYIAKLQQRCPEIVPYLEQQN